MDIRPLNDRVIIEPLQAAERSAGGIIIPDTAQEKPVEGKVAAVGPGAVGKDGKRRKLDIKKGDRVLYGKWSGTEVKVGGKDLVIMHEHDILAVVGKGAVVHASAKAPALATAGADHHHHAHDDDDECCDD